jgi:hypothetical protein
MPRRDPHVFALTAARRLRVSLWLYFSTDPCVANALTLQSEVIGISVQQSCARDSFVLLALSALASISAM